MRYAEYVSKLFNDPGFTQYFKKYAGIIPPKRKVILLLDKDLPIQVIDDFRSVPDTFKIIKIASEKEDDEFLFREASKQKAILVTKDEDFWDDAQFPLRNSPGVIIVRGKTSEEVDKALGLFFALVGVVDAVRRDVDWVLRQKFKVSLSGFVSKILTNDSKKEIEKIEY